MSGSGAAAPGFAVPMTVGDATFGRERSRGPRAGRPTELLVGVTESVIPPRTARRREMWMASGEPILDSSDSARSRTARPRAATWRPAQGLLHVVRHLRWLHAGTAEGPRELEPGLRPVVWV